MHLSDLCQKESKFRGELEELRISELPVLIFGTGSSAIQITEWLEKHAIQVMAYCETSAFYCPDKTILGKPVYEFESLENYCDECNLVIAASGEGVRDVWEHPGKAVKKVYYFNCITPVYGDVKMTYEWVDEHIEELDEVYHILEDEDSRQVFLSYLEERAGCMKGSVPHLFELCTSGEYFNSFYNPNQYKQHVLIDCGAYTGDTAERFLEFVRVYGENGKVMAFEPDKKNFRLLEETAEKVKVREGVGEIQCFPYAVGEKKGEYFFKGAKGIESHCVEKDSEEDFTKIPVISLDDVLKDVTVSMIKMDIEGSELDALKGAQRIISEQMPFLAICVYHRDDDLIRIPQYIKMIAQRAGKEYKFYLRHHAQSVFDTVMYAVPCF